MSSNIVQKMPNSFLFLKDEDIFPEIQSVKSYDVILYNLGWDIDFTVDYDVIPPLNFIVGLTSDTDVNPSLDIKWHNFWAIGVN